MDSKSKLLFDAKSQLIDSNLAQEIDGITRQYTSVGQLDSLEMNDKVKRAKVMANDAKKLALWELEKELQSSTQPQSSNSGHLIFNKDGSSFYTAASGKTYKAKFKLGTNSYKLLHYLAGNAGSLFSYTDLIKLINKPRQNADSLDETRIRETIQIIRREFGLTKNNKTDDLFKVDGKHFGIRCNAEIRQSSQTS